MTITAPEKTVPTTPDEVVEEIRREIEEIGTKVLTSYTLADAMREGSKHSPQLFNGYVNGSQSCALGAAFLAAKARGYLG